MSISKRFIITLFIFVCLFFIMLLAKSIGTQKQYLAKDVTYITLGDPLANNPIVCIDYEDYEECKPQSKKDIHKMLKIFDFDNLIPKPKLTPTVVWTRPTPFE